MYTGRLQPRWESLSRCSTARAGEGVEAVTRPMDGVGRIGAGLPSHGSAVGRGGYLYQDIRTKWVGRALTPRPPRFED